MQGEKIVSEIVLEGMEEFEELLGDMVLDKNDEKKAVREGVKALAKGLEEDSPRGESGYLSKIKVSVKDTGLGIEGSAKSNAFYDKFQDYGTSEQKSNVGYFERSVKKNEEIAIEKVAETIFKKIR